MIFILFILVLFSFLYLNSRISTLEQLFRSKYSSPERLPTPTITPIQTVKQDIPLNTPTVSTPAPVPNPMQNAASHEEIGGRWLGKVGIIAVVVGILFFLQYAFQNNWVSPLGRVLIGVGIGVGLIALAQFLRAKHQTYSTLLSGGGLAVLYIADFAASNVYNLIPTGAALFVAILITVGAVVLSVVNSSKTLSFIGITGCFLSLLGLSSGREDMLSVLSFVLILNVGILAISYWKHWTSLNYATFIGTGLTILMTIGSWYSASSDLALVMLFLTLYFFIFLKATILHHFVRNEKTNSLDISLLTLNAAAYFLLSNALLLPQYEFILGYFVLALAVIYLLLAYLAGVYNKENKVLITGLTGIASVFAVLFIPLQFDQSWITLGWLAEAVVLYAVSFRGKLPHLQTYAAIVFFLGVIRLMAIDKQGEVAFLNWHFVLMLVAAIVSYVIAWMYHVWNQGDGESKKQAAVIFFVIANFLTLFGISSEIYTRYEIKMRNVPAVERVVGDYGVPSAVKNYTDKVRNERNAVVSVVWTLYAIILMVIGFAARLRHFRSLGLVLFFITALKVFGDIWSLGQIYRIVSSIVYGVVALIGSFFYSKYKDRMFK